MLAYATVESFAPDLTIWVFLVPELMFASSLAGLLALTADGVLEYVIGGMLGLLASRLGEGRAPVLALLLVLTAVVVGQLFLKRAPDGLLGSEFMLGGQLGYLWFLVEQANADSFLSMTDLLSALLALVSLRLYLSLSTLSQPLKALLLVSMTLVVYVMW